MTKKKNRSGFRFQVSGSSENEHPSHLIPRTSNLRYVFFGAGEIARAVLAELLQASLAPTLIVTAPDRVQGRGLALTPSPVAALAAEHGIETLKPAKLDDDFIYQLSTNNYQPPRLSAWPSGWKKFTCPEENILWFCRKIRLLYSCSSESGTRLIASP